MPHMILAVTGKKLTSRDGSHPDDEEYLEQVKSTIGVKLIELGFHNPSVHIVWDNA